MFGKKLLAGFLFAAVSTTFLSPAASAQRVAGFASADDAFLGLRDAARREDDAKANAIAASIGDYPIPSYVDYYRIRAHIKDASASEVLGFIDKYRGSAIADRLRNDWLLELGKRGDWATFDVQYPLFALDDDTQLKCYALMSKALKGGNVSGQARVLLATPKNYGEACVSLIGLLLENKQFDEDDLWTQVRLAAEAGSSDVVRRLMPLTGMDDDALMTAMDKPGLILAKGPGFRRIKHEVFIVALGRAARNDPQQAAAVLESRDGQRLSNKQQQLGWAAIALQSARKLQPEAVEYWRRAGKAPLSTEAHEWKVRSALRVGDWELVHDGIEMMPPALRNDATWTYWLGRALREKGQRERADALFHAIAVQPGFYGQLALEELGQHTTIPPRAAPVTAAELAPMESNAGFRRAFRFFELGLRFEGYREWNWELRGMNERQLLAAAEFARRNDVLDRMVNTSDRTIVELDYEQRFPTPHREVMEGATQRLQLEMAWVYGLIRQESRFVRDARSHVGASGLMQLMPATARYVAKKIGYTGFRPAQVNEVQTNVLLGTSYLSMVLNDLEGSQTMATAAYNAGPGRPRAWRSTLTTPVEGAIFAESIPFTETRDYVKKVLSNATYYAAMFEHRPQSLKARLGMVGPAVFVPTALP